MHTIFDTAGTQYAVARKRLDDRSVVYTVHAGEELELVARAVLDGTRGSVSDVLVWPAWRRRGIATALYRLIEWEQGAVLRPSRIRSRLGRSHRIGGPGEEGMDGSPVEPSLPIC